MSESKFDVRVSSKGLTFIKKRAAKVKPAIVETPAFAMNVPITELMKDLVGLRAVRVMKAQINGLVDEVVINGKSTKFDRRFIAVMKNIERLAKGEAVK